ncbi:MAG: sulfatase-like hydrolase/transferase [Nanoarchaeota archaeon]|nr:sulfatase-like hydrolase/transferase [Nanoarchaeota archaeon]
MSRYPDIRHVREIKTESLLENNVLFITMCSCRYDTAEKANIPAIRKLGELRKAYTHGDYTVSAHKSFFNGRLPVVMDDPKLPFYSEAVSQLWRINSGKPHEADKKRFPIILEENNIIEGYRKQDYKIIGIGGVSQFNEGSILRSYFNKGEFSYYGTDMTEEPLEPRKKEQFPFNHLDNLLETIHNYDKWFLFINCSEAHYPYDIGNGLPDDVLKYFDYIKLRLNLRDNKDEQTNAGKKMDSKLHSLQTRALESIDNGIKKLLYNLPHNRDILTVICGDHGENFGEIFAGKQRWGHLFPSKEVMEVPLVIGQMYWR